VESYRNQTIKFKTQLGDLRIRKENDELPNELKSPGTLTLKKEEKSMRKVLRLKEAGKKQIKKGKTLIVAEKKNKRKLERVI
jgi:hypothetical protein